MPLSVKDGMGAWIDDFAKSDAPQFKGKNKEERRDMAIAAYLTAKRGPEKEEKVRVEAQTAKQKADMAKAMAIFKKRGGKVNKVAPGRAQGAHGKDDLGTGMMGMLNKGDTSRFKTKKKIGSMREAVDPKMKKVKQLANLGLVSKPDVMKLMQAMKQIDDGKELTKKHRSIIFDAFGSLIDLVTGDMQVFQKAKKSVKEEYQFDEAVNYRFVAIDRVGKVIGFASKESDAKDMARRNRGKVVALKKPMSPKKGDMMVNRPFKEDIQEDGHTDVASAMTNVKVAMAALTKMSGELAKLKPEDSLPSWWTNKVAIAVDKLDGMADYLDTKVEQMDHDFGTPESTKAYKKATPGQNEARVIDTKAMSAYMKYAKAKKVDADSIRMAFDNPNHPESKRMMKNKNFATALKMYKASGK